MKNNVFLTGFDAVNPTGSSALSSEFIHRHNLLLGGQTWTEHIYFVFLNLEKSNKTSHEIKEQNKNKVNTFKITK